VTAHNRENEEKRQTKTAPGGRWAKNVRKKNNAGFMDREERRRRGEGEMKRGRGGLAMRARGTERDKGSHKTRN